jgi:hypothetical protein
MALSETERETIIGMTDADDVAYIYSAQRKVITKLKKIPGLKILEEGVFEGSAFIKCELPANLISIRKPTTLTAEQRAARSATMAATRARQLGSE